MGCASCCATSARSISALTRALNGGTLRAIDEAGLVIEIDASSRASKGNLAARSTGAASRSWKPSTQASMMRSISSGVRSRNGSIRSISFSTSARKWRASAMARFSMSVLSIMPLFSIASAEPRFEAAQRAEAVKGIEVVSEATGRSRSRGPACRRGRMGLSGQEQTGQGAGAFRLLPDPARGQDDEAGDGVVRHRLEIAQGERA